MMCRFVACAWGEQTPQLRPLSGQRGCVGGTRGRETEGQRQKEGDFEKDVAQLLRRPCRVTRVTSCQTVFLSVGDGERK